MNGKKNKKKPIHNKCQMWTKVSGTFYPKKDEKSWLVMQYKLALKAEKLHFFLILH